MQTHRLLIGQRLPEFRLLAPTGEILTLKSFAGRAVFVLFVKPGCQPCHEMAEDLAVHVAAWKSRLAVVLVARAPASPSDRFWRKFARSFPPNIALAADPGGVLSDAVTDRVPYGTLLDANGTVRWISDGYLEERAEGADALDRWVNLTPADDADAAVEMPLLFGRPLSEGRSLPLWTPAAKPSGERLDLSSGAAVLTFASPGCGSCGRQIESLRELAVEHPNLSFVLVGRSAAEVDQLSATYLHDSPAVEIAVVDAAVGRGMGVRGVPTTQVIYKGRIWFCTSAWSREAELVRAVAEVGMLVSRARTADEPPPGGVRSYRREQ